MNCQVDGVVVASSPPLLLLLLLLVVLLLLLLLGQVLPYLCCYRCHFANAAAADPTTTHPFAAADNDADHRHYH